MSAEDTAVENPPTEEEKSTEEEKPKEEEKPNTEEESTPEDFEDDTKSIRVLISKQELEKLSKEELINKVLNLDKEAQDLEERINELEVALLDTENTLKLIQQATDAAASGGPPPPPSDDFAPPPPGEGGPPPPPGGGPPPPPGGGPPAPGGGPPLPKGVPVGGRSMLLASIEGFSKGKLKKAKTADKSGPVTTTAKSSGPSGNPLAVLAASQLKNLKKLDGKRTASGRICREKAAQNRAAVALFANLKKGGGGPPPSTGGSQDTGPSNRVDFRAALRSGSSTNTSSTTTTTTTTSSSKVDFRAALRPNMGSSAPPKEEPKEQSNKVDFRSTLKKGTKVEVKEQPKEQPPAKVDFRGTLKKSTANPAATKTEAASSSTPDDPNACPKCKNSIRVGAKFCTKCGCRITAK